MEFEWDEAKREANIAKHGIDYIFAQSLFDGRFVITAQSPRAGEDRYATTGRIDGRFITAIWTWRNGAVRIISARRARREEEQRYRALLGTTD
jgi:uncharacterized DUF497 family protein